MNASIFERIADLVRSGDDILRTTQPHERQMKRHRWNQEVRNLLQSIPEAEQIGIKLAKDSVAADVGLLARYGSFLEEQLGSGDDNLTESAAISGTRKVTREMVNDQAKPVSPPGQDDVLRIFISRKDEDQRTARGVKEALERYGAGRIEIYVAEDIRSGSDWIDWIKLHLSKANLFILIFTDDTQDWGWCLYEAGLFTNLTNIKERPVICLHNQDLTPPEPLRHLQAVPARRKELKGFLVDIFTKSERFGIRTPLNSALADQPDELERAADEIEILVSRQAVEKKLLCHYLFLTLQDDGFESIDPAAKVTGSHGAFEIFGLEKRDWCWNDIERQARLHDDQRWLEEVKNAVPAAAQGSVFNPIQATVVSARDGKLYRPVLYRVDTLADQSKTFKFMFTEEVTWNIEKIPPTIATLSTALSMAIRFRYEVLIPYRETLLSARGHNVEESFKRLLAEIERIEMEAASRGVLEEVPLAKAFKKKDRPEVTEMFGVWYQIRSELFDSQESLPSDQQLALIDQLMEINRSFFNLVTSRMAGMTADED